MSDFIDSYDRAFEKSTDGAFDVYTHPDLKFTVAAGAPWAVAQRMADSMPPPTPPAPPPTPYPVYRTSAPLTSEPIALDGTLRVLRGISTSVAGLLNKLDAEGSVGALVGSIRVVGGRARLRLVEEDVATGSVRVMLDREAGPETRAVTFYTPQPLGPFCRYVLEGQLLDATEATLLDASLALYEVVP